MAGTFRDNRKTIPATEFERMLSQFPSNTSESVKEVERIIKTPDSETKLTYQLQLDSKTGQQKVVENFTTTKCECAVCGGYFSHMEICEDCGARVCVNDTRRHSVLLYKDSRGNEYPSTVDVLELPRNHKIFFRNRRSCRSCAITYGIKD